MEDDYVSVKQFSHRVVNLLLTQTLIETEVSDMRVMHDFNELIDYVKDNSDLLWVSFDAECIDGDESYQALLHQYAKCLESSAKVTDIQSNVDSEDNARISLKINGTELVAT